MKGTEIIVSACPQGKFSECIISGTPLPGTCLEVVPGSTLTGGRQTMRAVTRSTGAKGPICILLADSKRGKLYNSAYADGSRGQIYWPIAGEEFNMCVADVAGTGSAEDQAVGALYGVQTGTGKLAPDSSFASTPFTAQEATHGFVTADRWVWMQYNGNNA